MARKKVKKGELHGFVELANRLLEEEKASGRTPEQSRAKSLMDFQLSLAKRGEVLRLQPHWISGVVDAAALGREWLLQQIQDSSDEQHKNILAAMHFALGVLMENVSLHEQAKESPPREKGPSADELCSSCRTRIEDRYLPPLDSTESRFKASPIKLYFPVGQRRNFRTNMIRAAWQTASKHNLFPSKGRFARYASKRVHLTVRWILKCIEHSAKNGRQA